MQYEVEIGGRARQVVVRRAGDRFEVTVDGRTWDVDAARVDAHTLSLIVEARTEIRLKPDATKNNNVHVGSGLSRTVLPTYRRTYEVAIARDPATGVLNLRVGATPVAVALNGRRRSRGGDQGQIGSGPQRIVAPMPGKIVRVGVKPGEVVRARQTLVVIEAMKMENELRAGRDGTVGELHAREGLSVEAGALLVVIQ